VQKMLSAVLAVALLFAAAPVSFATPNPETRQVLQGTQVTLTLLNSVGTTTSREGDPFVAVVAEPVFLGNQLLIPIGTRINGVIGTVATPRRFSLFRGEAYMNLTFRSLEIDSRLIPIQMSILTIQQPGDVNDAKARKDMKIEEGGVVQTKHDFKGDAIAATVGAGGGSLVGAIFGEVVRGFGIGLAGSAVYVMARKGKQVEIPARSGLRVRMDNSITMPTTVASDIPAPPIPADK
jgi:hypothetical protein